MATDSENRSLMRSLTAAMLFAAVAVACSDAVPTQPRATLDPPEARGQTVLVPALGYETIVVGEEIGLEGSFFRLAPNGFGVVRRASDGRLFSYAEGELVPFADAEAGVLGANGHGVFAGVGSSGAATFFLGQSSPLEGPLFAYGINDAGVAVGTDGTRGVIWENGQVADVVTVDGYSSSALFIANSGDIVVRNALIRESTEEPRQGNNFLYRDGVITEIPNLAPFTIATSSITGKGLSENGRVIGLYYPDDEAGRPWYYMDGVTRAVEPLPGYDRVDVLADISASGLAVGSMSNGATGETVAITYDGSAIDVLIDPPMRSGSASVNALDAVSGIVYPTASSGGEVFVAVDGEIRLLPLPEDAEGAFSPIIDDLGGVGATIVRTDGTQVPVYWRPDSDALEDNLVDVIEKLVEDGVLVPGVGNALLEKLANGDYNAFINQVRALIRSGRLDPTVGDALIRAAEQLMG